MPLHPDQSPRETFKEASSSAMRMLRMARNNLGTDNEQAGLMADVGEGYARIAQAAAQVIAAEN